MRSVPILAAAILATVTMREPVHAQSARATLEVAATVVETPRVRMDATAATVTTTRDGAWLAVPLAVSGAGSPTVAVASDGQERACEAVSSTAARTPGARAVPWLRCGLPRTTALGGITEIQVELVIVPAT
jgi:hypothetical protein